MPNTGFQSIVGHKDVIRHMMSAIENDRVAHAYLLTGDPGCGKKTIADAFAMALECRDRERSVPCLICPSCRKAADRNHPDIIYVTHEKPGVISVSEIRSQVVGTVDILPYESRYKVYIIPDAEKMNPQAQNALLKTIEEPPSYVVLLLLASAPESLLPTIRSRCITLPLLPIADRQVDEFLRTEIHVPDYEAKVLTAFAQGNIGRAVAAATDEDFTARRDQTISLVRNIHSMDSAAVTETVRQMKDQKDRITDFLDMLRMWFRDVLYFKATRDVDQLIFSGEIRTIRRQASASSYEGLQEIVSAIDRCRTRLDANVNYELALELLLFDIRENCRG